MVSNLIRLGQAVSAVAILHNKLLCNDRTHVYLELRSICICIDYILLNAI